MVSTVTFERDEEGFILDENGERVLPNEPQMSPKTGKRKKAKPRVLTDAKVRKICELIKQGNFVKQSCISAGVSYNTFRKAMDKGKKKIRPYDEWYEWVEVAKAEAETDKVAILNEHMMAGNVGVIQWWLSRMFPNRWEKTERLKAKVDNSQKIEIVRYSDKVKGKEEELDE